MELDYERFGRQIALPELGARGQAALTALPVCFVEAGAAGGGAADLAAALHARAGGAVARGDEGAPCVQIPETARPDAPVTPLTLGVAAWAAVEGARIVLGRAPATLPNALLARLGPAARTTDGGSR